METSIVFAIVAFGGLISFQLSLIGYLLGKTYTEIAKQNKSK